jgi:5-methylcytosine-specific restriction endonuclease McrA
MTKRCTLCGEIKNLDAFERRAEMRDGHRNQCRRCRSDPRRDYARAHSRRYYGNPEGRPGFESRPCTHCGNAFLFHVSAGNKRTNRGLFCSRACFHKYRRVTLTCLACRQPFITWRCMKGERKYCSQICAGTALRPHAKRKKEARLDTPEWQLIRAQILERDSHACQWCASGVDLIVHHIVDWKESRDDSPSNLITLCRGCHSRVHRLNKEREALTLAS